MINWIFFLQAGGLGEAFASTWPLFFIVIIFYFITIRPQQQRQKAQNAFLGEMEKGDEVVTASGIIGRVSKIEDEVVTLQLDQKVFIRVTKSAVSKEMTDSVFNAKETA